MVACDAAPGARNVDFEPADLAEKVTGASMVSISMISGAER